MSPFALLKTYIEYKGEIMPIFQEVFLDMKAKLALKTLYRSPVRTILTFILLAAVTFALFSQVMEHAVTQRELDNAISTYFGAGNVENTVLHPNARRVDRPLYIYSDPRVSSDYLTDENAALYRSYKYEPITQEEIDVISNLPYVTYSDTRYMTAGVSEEYRRLDDGDLFYNYVNTCVVEGTVTDVNPKGRLIVDDLKLVAGHGIEPFKTNEYIFVCVGTAVPEDYEDGYVATYGGAPRAVSFTTPKSIYTHENMDIYETGKRYAFVLRYETYYAIRPEVFSYYLTDPFIYDWCDAVWDITDAPVNYLSTEKFAPLKQYCELINTDHYTFDVVYSNNTNSIGYFADKTMGLSAGRHLTPKDSENNAQICVIHHNIAVEYDLKLGDTITLNLGNVLFEQNKATGAVAVVPERLSTEYTPVTLKIVGTFKDARRDEIQQGDANMSYSFNTIFVPKSLLPVEESQLENHTFAPGEFSFIVGNAWDIPAFAAEVAPMVEDMGLELIFNDGGWPEKIQSFKEALRISLIKIFILTAAALISVVYVSYLYIVAKRKDFAIMRALGTSKRRASYSLVLPLGVISSIAVTLGTVSALVYTHKTINSSKTLALLESESINTTIPVEAVALCVLGVFALCIAAAAIMLILIGRLPPLELLQGNARRTKTKEIIKDTLPDLRGSWVSLPKPEHDGKNRTFSFSWRYIRRHILRTAKKSALCIIVTVLLLSIVGQLSIMGDMYLEMYNNTKLFSQFAGGLNLYSMDKLYKSGYVDYVYYCKELILDIDQTATVTYITSDIAYTVDDDIEVTYLDGYDDTVMSSLGSHIVMGSELMKERGLELGDTVELSRRGYYAYCSYAMPVTAEVYRKIDYLFTEEGIMEAIDEMYRERMFEFTIVGSVTSESHEADYYMFMPGSLDQSVDFGRYALVQPVEAYLADNNLAEEYHELGTELANGILPEEVAFLMDETAKAKHLKNNVELIDTLLPIISASVMVIGVFICSILITQSSKDIAIMRVLGTTKKRTRNILILEQMILSIVGILISAVVLAIRRVPETVFMQMLLIFTIYTVVVLLGSIIAAIAASRKNVLELLQTKE